MATTSEPACLVQRQRAANHNALTDEVMFITEGLKETSTTVLESALHSLRLFSSEAQRDQMLEAGVYLDLLTSVTEVNSTGSLSGDIASLSTLLGAHMFMVHCNLVSSKGNSGHKAALQHVSMGTLCKLLASMLSLRAYLTVKPKKAHAAELKKTKEVCKAWALLPPGFENSPQALLLVATRCMLDTTTLCEDAKTEAVGSGLLNQLRSIACENLAVLTGRRAGNFTDRTNSCMWFANMSLACLERLTAAQAENCLSLVTSSVEFSRGKRTGFPVVPLACVQLVRNKQLIANRATQICVETCLQLLMNLTHSGAGSALVAEHKGIESLTEIVWNLSTSCSKDGPENTTAAKVPGINSAEDRLPETQDLLAGVSELLSGPEGGVHANVEGASKYQRQVTSAVCVLANMVEHHAPSALCIARTHVQDASEPDGGRNASTGGAWGAPPIGAKGEPGVLSEVHEGKEGNQASPEAGKEGAQKPPRKAARLAVGSRRRRVKDDKKCNSSQPSASGGPSKMDVADSQATSSPFPIGSLGSFMRMCCELLQKVWKAEGCESQQEESKDGSNLGFLKLYLAILLGVVVHRCPEVRDDVAAAVDVVHVVEDMESGLQFYATHGAIEESSEKFLQSAIDSLKC